MPNRNKKGAILFIVLGVIMVVSVLATAILRIIANQSRLTHHQVNRIKAQYAAKAGMVLAFDKLRTGAWTQGAYAKYYCINGPVDSTVTCLDIVSDTAIPHNVQIGILPPTQPGIDDTIKLEIKTDYSSPNL